MRQFLSFFPIDRADLDRHAATVRSHFATSSQRQHAAFVGLAIVTLAANGLALVVMIGGGR